MLLSRTLAFPHPSQIPELPSLSQGDSQGLQMESLSNGLSEKSWVKGLFTACVGNDGEAQDLATGMPAAAPGLRAGQRAWWPHPRGWPRGRSWKHAGPPPSSLICSVGTEQGSLHRGQMCALARWAGLPALPCISAWSGLTCFFSVPLSFPSVCLPLSLSSHSRRRFCSKNVLQSCSLTSQRSPERSAAGARVLSAPGGHLGSVRCSLCTCLKCFS